MLPANSFIGRLLAAPIRLGLITWIGVRPARREGMLVLSAASLIVSKGVAGDHYDTARDGPRQVTIIANEDISAISGFLGMPMIAPDLLRRNLVTSGINVFALKDRRFRVGSAILEGSGECAPCSLLEAALGPGAYNAVRGHGGITARVVESGQVNIGDTIERIDEPAA